MRSGSQRRCREGGNLPGSSGVAGNDDVRGRSSMRTAVRLISLLFAIPIIGGGLLVAPASAGGCVEPVTDEQGVRVDLTGVCFRPTVLRVEAGQRVEWTNDDAFDHTVPGANLAWGSIDKIHAGD